MMLLYTGLALFFIPHFYSAMRSRAEGKDIRVRMGEGKYMGLYSIVTLIGFGLMLWGYAKAPNGAPLFEGPHLLHHFAWIPMMIAFILLISAYTPLGHIKRTVQHPMMLATLIWSLTHLLMGGDLKKVLLFGGFAAYSFVSLVFAFGRGTELRSQPAKIKGDIIAIILGLILMGAIMHGGHLFLFKASPM